MVNVFIDANIYLDFYRFTKDDFSQIEKVIAASKSKKINLILTEQVVSEFRRNREKVVSEKIDELKKSKVNNQWPRLIQGLEHFDAIKDAQNNYEKTMNALQKEVEEKALSYSLAADKAFEEILQCGKFVETQDSHILAAKKRMTIGNPPRKNSQKDASHGDAINWEMLLDCVENGQDVNIVARDGDYASAMSPGVISRFLADEWKTKKTASATLYVTLSGFFSKNFPDLRFAIEFEKMDMIKRLENSGSFYSTHRAIEQFSSVTEYTKNEANRIIKAAIDNDQIHKISCDDDVFKFFTGIFEKYKDAIPEDVREAFSEKFDKSKC